MLLKSLSQHVIHGNPLVYHHDGLRTVAFQSGFLKSPACRQPHNWRSSGNQWVEIPIGIGAVCSGDIPLDENPETNSALNSVSTCHGFDHCHNLHCWLDDLSRAIVSLQSGWHRADCNRHIPNFQIERCRPKCSTRSMKWSVWTNLCCREVGRNRPQH